MGLFDLFKKKKSSQRKIRVEIYSDTDRKEVPLFEKNNTSNEIKPVEYYRTLEKEIKPLENAVVDLAVSLKKIKLIDDRIVTLSMLIDSFYSLKNKCKSLGAEYSVYFSETWEHCHTSKNPNFNYIERFEKELTELHTNYDDLKAEEDRYIAESKDLTFRVIAVIKQSPGILQKDIYKLFDPIVKNDIRDIIYKLEKNRIVNREKNGNTYKVTYLEKQKNTRGLKVGQRQARRRFRKHQNINRKPANKKSSPQQDLTKENFAGSR